jgi:hypothetical protein
MLEESEVGGCRMARIVLSVVGLLCTCVAALPALAGNGRIEINQIAVLASGGFPFTLGAPGSYVLTSDLDVPAADDGLLIASDDVQLDLNGFSLRGPFLCIAAGCIPGITTGIRAATVLPAVDPVVRTSVIHGQIRGFGDDCLSLGAEARIEGVAVSSCGGDGIFAVERSLVLASHVTFCGASALNLINPSSFVDNMLAVVGLAGGGGSFFTEGIAGGGNACNSGPCGGSSRKRFYLTQQFFTGDVAAEAGNCADEFHFASLSEIHEPSARRYDTTLGLTLGDSGQGAPMQAGWIRTGTVAISLDGGDAINPNCNGWSNTGIRGTTVQPAIDWTSAGQRVGPWETSQPLCSATRPIWCAEN